MKNIIATIILLLIIITSSAQAELDEHTVTYSDFQYVRFIASSISHVYFATTEGITRYNKLEKRWEEPLTSSDGINQRDVLRIWVDEFDEKLYASTTISSYEYDLLFNKWFPIPSIPSVEIKYSHINPPDIMYLPGGYNFTGRNQIIDPHGRDFQLTDLVDDLSGNMWVGTWGYGAGVSTTTSNVVDFIPFGLIQNRVDAIFNYDGELYLAGANFGSYRTGITKFEPEELFFEHIESGFEADFPDADVLCLEIDKKNIYAGTELGLVIINRENQTVIDRLSQRHGLPDDYILSLEKIGDSLFIGTTSGLGIYYPENDTVSYFRPGQFKGEYIYDLEKTDSTLWIASTSGAYQYHFEDKQLQQFQDPSLIIFSEAQSLSIFENMLWLASPNGLVKVDLKTAKTFGYPMPLYNLKGENMVANETIAAIPSTGGLRLIYHKDPDKINEIEFDQSDGIPSNLIHALLLDGDFLWIGTDKGLTRFLWNDPFRVD